MFENIYQTNGALKFNETLVVTLKKITMDDMIEFVTAYFNSEYKTVLNKTHTTENVDDNVDDITEQISQWLSNESGFVVDSIVNHIVNIVKYIPYGGSSYIDLPPELKNSKKGLMNIKNSYDKCMLYCFVRYLYPKKDPQRITQIDKFHAKQLEKTFFKGVTFPVTEKDYEKMAKQSQVALNFCVYNNVQKRFTPRSFVCPDYEKIIDLLLITVGEKWHYVFVKNFESMLYNQTKHKDKKFACRYCRRFFSSERVGNEHKKKCYGINGNCLPEMPRFGEKVNFENVQKRLQASFVIYADFEVL